ncbi:MAG: hypothetical protein AB7O91_03335 [Sphingomonas sp.]
MSLLEIERAQRAARLARARFDATLGEVQERLRPANLAGEAWDGVKEKSANLADDAVDAVKARPGMVSLALGAVALFVARKPIGRAVTGLVSRDGDGIEDEDSELNEEASAEA